MRKRLIIAGLIIIGVVVRTYLAKETVEFLESTANASEIVQGPTEGAPYLQVDTHTILVHIRKQIDGSIEHETVGDSLEEFINGKIGAGWELTHITSCAIGDKVFYTMIYKGGY